MTDVPARPDADAAPASAPDCAVDPAIDPAMKAAVRARALDRIRQEQERTGPTRKDRIQVLIFTTCAVTLLVIFLNFVVTGLHRIMDIWYPGSISSRVPQPEQPIDPNKAYMIGVIVEGESSSSSSSSSLSSSDAPPR